LTRAMAPSTGSPMIVRPSSVRSSSRKPTTSAGPPLSRLLRRMSATTWPCPPAPITTTLRTALLAGARRRARPLELRHGGMSGGGHTRALHHLQRRQAQELRIEPERPVVGIPHSQRELLFT